jgi:hypothetical protein
MSRVALFLALVLAACASSPSPKSETLSAKLEPRAEKDEELSRAFQDETPVPSPEKEKVKPPPPLPDPFAVFRSTLEAGGRSFLAHKLEDAETKFVEAVRLAGGLTGEERYRAYEALTRLAIARGNGNDAFGTTREWLKACGPEKAEPCRAAAVQALLQVEKLKGPSAAKAKALHDGEQKADACLDQAERSGTAPKCLADAEKTAHTDGDLYLAERIALAKAMAEKAEPRRLAALEHVAASCPELACAELRRKAYAVLVNTDLAKKNPDLALRHELLDVQVHLSRLPESLRPWGRPPELDKVCAQVDAVKGAGACRKAEKQALGLLTFKDFSVSGGGDGLSADAVREVNEHYAPLMQECLGEQAKRLTPPDAERYEVRWMVFNDGRVGEAHLRRDLDDSELAKCLRQQFLVWRYPRYEGEWQHVEQSYTVTAVERRH